MKSTNEQLKNRGFAFDEDILLYKHHTENDLLQLLQDKEAHKRTIAVKLLSKYNKEKYIKIFYEKLKIENK